MNKEKILREHYEKIIYSKEDWTLLRQKRDLAIKLLEMFAKEGFNPYIHGSIARGDIHESSDIDIIFFQTGYFQFEHILVFGFENIRGGIPGGQRFSFFRILEFIAKKTVNPIMHRHQVSKGFPSC